MISREKLNELREKYPVGTKIVLKGMNDPQAPPVGTVGRIVAIDDIGTIHTAWQINSGLGLVYGVDEFEVIKED